MSIFPSRSKEIIGTYLGVQTVPASSIQSGILFSSGISATAANVPWPIAALISNMNVRVATAQPATGALIITLFVNQVASILQVTVPAGGGGVGVTISNDINTVPINAKDVLRWNLQNLATSASAQLVSITMLMTQ